MNCGVCGQNSHMTEKCYRICYSESCDGIPLHSVLCHQTAKLDQVQYNKREEYVKRNKDINNELRSMLSGLQYQKYKKECLKNENEKLMEENKNISEENKKIMEENKKLKDDNEIYERETSRFNQEIRKYAEAVNYLKYQLENARFNNAENNKREYDNTTSSSTDYKRIRNNSGDTLRIDTNITSPRMSTLTSPMTSSREQLLYKLASMVNIERSKKVVSKELYDKLVKENNELKKKLDDNDV